MIFDMVFSDCITFLAELRKSKGEERINFFKPIFYFISKYAPHKVTRKRSEETGPYESTKISRESTRRSNRQGTDSDAP